MRAAYQLTIGLMLSSLASCVEPASSPPGSQSVAELRTGYILRDGVPVEVTFEVREERAIFEGDIDLGPADEVAPSREALLRRVGAQGADGPRPLGVVTADTNRRWPQGQVPYVIESSVPNPQRIYDAIAHINASATGVQLFPRTFQGDYIIFRRTDDPNICGRSHIGRQGGAQLVLLNDNCGVSTVIHELGHALGLWHEQSRCDRDSYVQILWENIAAGRESQFQKHCSNAQDLEAYDEASVMHYHRWAFSKNGQPTIRSLRGLDHLIGSGYWLSTMDVHTLNRIYQPYGPSSISVSYPGGTPTISWSAVSYATSYSVNLMTLSEYQDRDYGNHISISIQPIANTSGTSLQDPSHVYTGYYGCDLSGGRMEYSVREYFYEVVTRYANGVSSRGVIAVAKVADCEHGQGY